MAQRNINRITAREIRRHLDNVTKEFGYDRQPANGKNHAFLDKFENHVAKDLRAAGIQSIPEDFTKLEQLAQSLRDNEYRYAHAFCLIKLSAGSGAIGHLKEGYLNAAKHIIGNDNKTWNDDLKCLVSSVLGMLRAGQYDAQVESAFRFSEMVTGKA
jgi:hypothetical protein